MWWSRSSESPFGSLNDRNTLIQFIDEYSLSKQDVDYGYSEFGTPESAGSDRLKKAQWWAGVFAEKARDEEEEQKSSNDRNFIFSAITFFAPELIAAKIETGGLWLGAVAAFGEDEATLKSAANLVPKKDWFDVVVHGDKYYEGTAFNIDGKTVAVKEVYELMLKNGYKNGTPVRLISCNAGKGVAQDLSNLTEAKVIAPMSATKVVEGGKIVTEGGSKYQVFKPEN